MIPHWDIVAACWLALVVYWTVNGLRVRAPKRSVSLVFTIPNTLLLYAGFVLALMQKFDVAPLSTRIVPSTEGFGLVGAMLTASGVAFAIWSRRVLGHSWSATARVVADQRLISGGPYAFVAHPIYTGILLALLGTALVGGTVGHALGLGLVAVSFGHKARMEERLMCAEFGDAYVAYRRSVKFLIPFVF
ncbi:MAG TPA: isoprenylcysteine carboxylmethyltransferase family protein [Pseudomonadales bacterium]|nr:isoprenylcysteine carboxylmethyltransferase family protein [Pseudomonadales bacterium]